MDNVISLGEFKVSKSESKRAVIHHSHSGQALALQEEVLNLEAMVIVKHQIFSVIPEFRFLVEDGVWDGEYEDSEPYAIRVRLKGTDISGYGNCEASAWLRLRASLMDEELM